MPLGVCQAYDLRLAYTCLMREIDLTPQQQMPFNRVMEENGDQKPVINDVKKDMPVVSSTPESAQVEKELLDDLTGMVSPDKLKEIQDAREKAIQDVDKALGENSEKEGKWPPVGGAALNKEGENLLEAIQNGHVKAGLTDKNEKLKRILLENGITEDEYNSKDVDELFKLYVSKNEPVQTNIVDLIDAWKKAGYSQIEAVMLATQGHMPPPANEIEEEVEEEIADEKPEDENAKRESLAKRYRDAGYKQEIVEECIKSGIMPPERSEILTPWSDDILNKLTKYYEDNKLLQLTKVQARERALKHMIGESREVAPGRFESFRTLPQDELFNKIGFTQEIIEERINTITSDKTLSQDQIEQKKRELMESIGGGELNGLIEMASGIEIVRRRRSPNAAPPVYRPDDLVEALEDANPKSITELKGILDSKVFNPLHKQNDIARSEARGINQYKSINEIAIDAMLQTGGDFARGGKYAIIKTENGKEILQQGNFMGWGRNRMIEYHETDVDNPGLDMYQGVYVAGGTRNVTIGEMFRVEAMFTDLENGYLSGMREQMYYEFWLFNKSRNNDAEYRKIMGDDENLPKAIQKFYYENTFTKEGTLDRILTLPTVGKDIDFTSRDAMREGNQDVGTALRTALLLYYHITDEEMLHKIENQFKVESPLFNNKTFMEYHLKAKLAEKKADETEAEYEERERKEIYDALKKIRKSDHLMIGDAIGLSKEYINKLKIDKDYKFKYEPLIEEMLNKSEDHFKDWNDDKDPKKKDYDKKRRDDFMDVLNPFSAANKDFDLKNETQERLRLYIMNTQGISYDEAKYAETFAFSMARWSGLAARHDLRGSAYDSWTKVLSTELYRSRQTAKNQGGIHGNPYSLGGFKRMGIDFFAGAQDLSGKSILEIIQGGQGSEVNLGKLDEIKFGDRVMEKFGTDHVQRVFSLYANIIETHEFSFDKVVVYDDMGRLVVDPKGATEFIDKFLKAMRYSYRTWPGTDYSKKIRVRDKDGKITTEAIAKSLWGREIYEDFVNGIDERGTVTARKGQPRRQIVEDKKTGKKHLESDGEVLQTYRDEAWKRPLMYAIAAEIYAHNTHESSFSKYRVIQLRKILEWLESLNGELEYDENDLKNTIRKKGEMFFGKQDGNWIREHSNTTRGSLNIRDGIDIFGVGALEGAVKGAKAFLKGIGIG